MLTKVLGIAYSIIFLYDPTSSKIERKKGGTFSKFRLIMDYMP